MSDRGQKPVGDELPPSMPAAPPPPALQLPLHTYMVQRWRMRIGSPLTFSGGERIIAVLESEPAPGLPKDVDVTVLTELP